jgi:hypothetical protein
MEGPCNVLVSAGLLCLRVFLNMFFFYGLYLPVILSVPGGHFARAIMAEGLVV